MKPKTDSIKKNNDLSAFKDTFFSNEIGMLKTDKGSFEFVLRKTGMHAKYCLFIDDAPENIEVAKSLGIKTILFKSLNQLIKELASFSIFAD